MPTMPVQAQAADPAVAQVQGFYDALLASMKSGGTAKSRYEKLKPAVEKAFDLQAMTATAVGPAWAQRLRCRQEGADRCLQPHDHRQLCQEFRFL